MSARLPTELAQAIATEGDSATVTFQDDEVRITFPHGTTVTVTAAIDGDKFVADSAVLVYRLGTPA